MTVDEKCVVELNGRSIDLSKIDNPRLASIFRERVHDGNGFLFRYGDYTQEGNYSHKDHHSDSTIGAPSHTGYSEHKDRYRDRS